MGDYRDLNHNGKVSDFERWNDYDDYKRIYGKNSGGGSNMGCSTFIMIGLMVFWVFDMICELIY